MKHTKDCRWEKTTDAECEYKQTHEYCPHEEHACDCKGVTTIEPEILESRIHDLEKIMVDQAITICTISRLLTEAKRRIEELEHK